MRQNPFLYPGAGQVLRQVTAGTLNRMVDPESLIIPAGGWTELINASDCLEIMFTIISLVGAGTSPGSPVALIERSRTANAPISGDIQTYSSLSPSANWSALSWNAGQALTGWFRVKNVHGGDSMQVTVQKRIL